MKFNRAWSRRPANLQGPFRSPDGEQLSIEVLKGPVGFHLGTHREGEAPSRASVEYWPTEAAARTALETGDWTANRNFEQPAAGIYWRPERAKSQPSQIAG